MEPFQRAASSAPSAAASYIDLGAYDTIEDGAASEAATPRPTDDDVHPQNRTALREVRQQQREEAGLCPEVDADRFDACKVARSEMGLGSWVNEQDVVIRQHEREQQLISEGFAHDFNVDDLDQARRLQQQHDDRRAPSPPPPRRNPFSYETRPRDGAPPQSLWRHEQTYTLYPPRGSRGPLRNWQWNAHLTPDEFVDRHRPSSIDSDVVFVQAPHAADPIPPDHNPFFANKIKSTRNYYAEQMGQVRVEEDEGRLRYSTVKKARDVIRGLADLLKCYSGAFVFRLRADEVDRTWRMLVDSLCSGDGSLRRKSKVHTMACRRLRTRYSEPDYFVAAYVSDIFNDEDVSDHCRLFSESLHLPVCAVEPDAWWLLGYRGRTVDFEGGIELPLPED